MPASKEKALQSIEKAKRWLEEACKANESIAFDSSVLASYLAMFHASRAILFFDGYREKSHACVARYLEEKYVKTGKFEKEWVELLDHHREIRHAGQYDLSFSATEDESEKALDSSSKYVERMEALLKSLMDKK
ncbi:MAG: HEPN domain-containing protein [Candidatus Aureabacteria bacterium]|nr:HEPN domain-containing protein [Candidatus Auribacterota bacterium]